MALKFNAGTQFENPEPGSYIARCYGVIDLGTQPHNGFQGNPPWNSRDVRLVFELPYSLMTGKFNAEHKGKPFSISTTMKQSLHPSAKLRKFLAQWRGRDFTPAEIDSYSPRKLIGAPCRLSLIADADNKFINISGVSKLTGSEVCAPAVNKTIFFSLEADEYDPKLMAELGQKTQEKIATSPEYAALNRPATQEHHEENLAEPGFSSSEEDVPF